MIVWPAKDPAEVLDFTWTVPLDAGDTVTAHTITRTDGTAMIDSDSATTTVITAWISGGADAETQTFSMTATTAGGRTFREVALLPVFDRASEMLALFRLRYPDLASVSDGQVGYWILDATGQVGDNWPTASQTPARLALAAHRASMATASIPTGITSFKSGDFQISMSSEASIRADIEQTVYGREFVKLRQAAFAGPRALPGRMKF